MALAGRVIVAGSIATDHLMHFPGRFVEQLIAEHLDKVSLSFLADDLVLRRGGVGANIAYGMGRLGERPLLVGAVGHDFDEYRAWLERHGVDCSAVYVSQTQHTARFVCTTDQELNQIATFYAGAMSEAREIDLAAILTANPAGLVLISADDPAAMLRHAAACRSLGVRFAADPSQQIARMDGPALRSLIDGADLLFTNIYEKNLLESKTGLSEDQVLALVNVRVTTLGAKGVEITGAAMNPIHVQVAKVGEIVEPTGVGDGFRAGFLTARAWGLSWQRSAEVGSLLAGLVLESRGPQEYDVDPALFLARLAESYGADCAGEVAVHLAA